MRMDVTPYVESLRHDLAAAAEAAGPEVREVAERLLLALDPAARLALMEAISQAATEITAEMPDGGVEVRLDGRDLAFVVDSGLLATSEEPALGPTVEDEEGEVARVTLRIPEGVKSRAEELASQARQSLNTWLVQTIRAATQHHANHIDLSHVAGTHHGHRDRRLTGWL